jgi:H+/Cl- antiporter ClcA
MEEATKRSRSRPLLRVWSSKARWWARHELALHLFRGMLLWAGLIGFLGALVTIGFTEAIHFVEYLLTGGTGSLVDVARGLPLWQRVLTPALGGCLAGLILQYGMSLARGKRRTTDYMEALTVGDGFISIRASLVKCTSSLFSIGSGGSIGREGAMVALAAMVGSTLCRILKFPTPQRRTMVACGAAAGIASAYNAPLAAAVFVAEVVVGSIEFEVIAPIIVSAVIANATVHGLLGYKPVFEIPLIEPVGHWELPFYLLLGILAGRLAPVYLWLLKRSAEGFLKTTLPLFVRLAMGGLGVGLISVLSPQVWGNGYDVVNSILQTSWTVQALLIILVLKVAATALTVGSGAVGGVFTPTLFVGAALGSCLGAQLHAWAPQLAGPDTAYAVVGMGAFLSATTRAPLMAILMVFEMTRQYEIVLPLMLASITANYLALPYGVSMYADALKRTARALPPDLSLTSLLTPEVSMTVAADAGLDRVKKKFLETPFNHVHVVHADGRWLGIIVRKALTTAGPEAVARDLILKGGRYLLSTTSVQDAVKMASEVSSELLPVVDAETFRFLGTVAKSDLVAVLRHGTPKDKPAPKA